MKLKKVIINNHFQENVNVVHIETKAGRFRIIESEGGLKISLIADDGNEQLSINPRATNMVVIKQAQ